MKTQIQSIHFDADVKLLHYVRQKCNKLDHYFDNIVDAQVFLRIDQGSGIENKYVEIKVNVPHEQIIAQHLGQKFEEGVDIVTDSLRRRLIKYKEKLRSV